MGSTKLDEKVIGYAQALDDLEELLTKWFTVNDDGHLMMRIMRDKLEHRIVNKDW